MIKYWCIILNSFLQILLMSLVPFMNVIIWNTFKLWNPLLYIQTVFVIILLLRPWIKDPKIRLRVSPITNSPLPTTRILHRRVISKLIRKMLLPKPPIQEQILGEEWRNNHPAPIMHVPRCVHLPHCSIHNGKSCLALLPCL